GRRKVSILWSALLRRTCRTCYTTRPSLLNGKARQASNFPRVHGSKDCSLYCGSFALQTIDTFGPIFWSNRLPRCGRTQKNGRNKPQACIPGKDLGRKTTTAERLFRKSGPGLGGV